MRIGTVRSEEARVFDSEAGYHHFHDEETGEAYGSFEVWWDSPGDDEDDAPRLAGWYWWACSPGCMPDGEAEGPFASSWLAKWDADPWSQTNDPL